MLLLLVLSFKNVLLLPVSFVSTTDKSFGKLQLPLWQSAFLPPLPSMPCSPWPEENRIRRLTATARGWSEEGLQQISSWLGAEQLHDKKAYLKEDSSIRSMVSALDCLLARRSADVLQGYSTSMEADKVLLNQGGLSPAMELSIRFRYRQKKLLTHLSQKDGWLPYHLNDAHSYATGVMHPFSALVWFVCRDYNNLIISSWIATSGL